MGDSKQDGDPVSAPPRRSARPPTWAFGAMGVLVIGVGLHTRIYDAWYIYEPVAIAGIALTVAGLIAWMLRAFECSRHGLAMVIASTAIGLVGAYVGAGGRIYYLFAAAACIFVLPLAVILCGTYLLMRRRPQAIRFGALVFACIIQAVMALGSNVLRQHDVAAARAWCDALPPAISRFHAENNYWPSDLDSDGIIEGTRPRLLRDESFYRLVDQEYEFVIRCRRPFLDTLAIEPIRWFFKPSNGDWKWEKER